MSVEGEGPEAPADWDNLRTPETYLGYGRGGRGADTPISDLLLNEWALAGEWTIGPENIVLDRAGGSIAFRFHSRDAHLVMSPGPHEPIPFHVRSTESRPAPRTAWTSDEDGTGLLDDGRMYQLVRQQDEDQRPDARGHVRRCRARRRTRSPSDSPRYRLRTVRIATWNVNSLKQRVPRLLPWLDERQPDVVCLQETKLADDALAELLGDELSDRGYEIAAHGEATWNGVAILSRVGLDDVVTGLADAPGFPHPEARAIAATCDGVRVHSVYVPNGRQPGLRPLRIQARVAAGAA